MLMPGLQVCLSGCQRFPADITIDRLHYAACTTCSHIKSTVLQTKKGRVFFGYFFPCSSQGFGAFLSAVCFMYLTTKVLSVSWKIPCKNLGFFGIARLTSSFIAGKKKRNHNICKSSVCLSVHLPVCYSDGGFWRISLSIVMFLFTYALFTLIFSLIPRTNKKQQGRGRGVR